MNTDIVDKLHSIAENLNLTEIVSKLDAIKARANDSGAGLVLPLIGEFSSGKTTLLSSLMDSKILEIQTKPTTATIYTIHFSSPSPAAQVLNNEGLWVDIPIDEVINNGDVKDAPVVNLFDTSTRIPASTILVDTPGLSSGDPRHKEALVEFLPQSDGAILVVDINTQVTKTLVDFVNNMKLANRPLYLVVTKIDTKTGADVERTKSLIAKIDVQQVACVSAPQGKMDEFYKMIAQIEKDKKKLVERVDIVRVKSIIQQMSEYIEKLKLSIDDARTLEDSLRELEANLRKINRNIDGLVSSVNSDIEEIAKTTENDFARGVSSRLYSIISGKQSDYDAECVSEVNSLSSIFMEQYRNKVQHLLLNKANERMGSDSAVSLRTLENIDLSNFKSDMHCQFNLNELGHEHDGAIALASKGVLAAGAVAVVVMTAGAAATAAGAAGTAATAAGATGTAATAAGAAGTAATAAGAATGGMSAAEGVIEGAEIVTLWSQRRKIAAMQESAKLADKKLDGINQVDQKIGQKVGRKSGIVQSMVGFVTDKAWGKPEREQAIYSYMKSSILPEFRSLTKYNGELVIRNVSDALRKNAHEEIDAINNELTELRDKLATNKSAAKERRSELTGYLSVLKDCFAMV